MHQAITFARQGKRSKSRKLLRRIIAADPHHEQAWLWLSYVGRNTADQIYAAEQVLQLNPQHRTISERIETLKLEQIRKAPRKKALPLLLDFAQQYAQNEQGWYLASALAEDVEDQIFALEKLVALNPWHKQAQARLKQLHALQAQPLHLGRLYEEQNDVNKAVEVYSRAYATLPQDKRDEITRRLTTMQHRRPYYEKKITRPTLTVLRLSMGTIVLYFLMILTHSGINPRYLTLLPLLGMLSVSIGSVLTATIRARPKPSFWYVLVRRQGTSIEPPLRLLGAIVGWCLMIIPYSVLLINGVVRIIEFVNNPTF